MSTYTDIRYDYNLPSTAGGAMKLISEQTASASASISFTGIDSTYRTYIFKFYNIHPSTFDIDFQFNLSTDNGSNYNVTKTTTLFYAQNTEADTLSLLEYSTATDLAQSTAYQPLLVAQYNGNDESSSGTLYLFNPSSTTYVKNFISIHNGLVIGSRQNNVYVAGYGNTTSAVNAINFKYSSGNIDDGTIKMYGIA